MSSPNPPSAPTPPSSPAEPRGSAPAEPGGEPGGRSRRLGRFKRGATGVAAPVPADASPSIDPVSGLPTRDHLHGWLEESIRRSVPTSSRVVLAFVSLGLLRDVNDTYGADKGDELIRQVGSRLQTIDLPGTKAVRYEGAEFAIVFEKLNHGQANEEIARFLVDLLAQPFELDGDHLTISPSVGTAISADNYESIDDMIQDAHRSLAQARDEGTHYEVHDETKRGRYETRVDESRLHQAIRGEEFLLHYQPIVKVDEGHLVGFEALIRWKAPGATNAGVLWPGDFLPLLEKTGMSVDVGQWVLQEACRQVAEWNARIPRAEPLVITCNISPRHLADADFVHHVTSAIEAAGIGPELLCLDLTEHSLRFNGSDAWPPLRELTNLGVKLSIDDFGTGVTSLHWLLELALDFVRIERSLVSQLDNTAYNRAHGLRDPISVILGHLANMARDLDIRVIAEGVETEEAAAAVAELGIPLAQGFLYGRPETAIVATTRVDPSADRIHIWDPNDVIENPVVDDVDAEEA